MPVFLRILAAVAVTTPLPPGAWAATGEEIYRIRCALCHDGGATQAPRVGQPGDWVRRVEKGRAGLLRSAIEGVRDSAMLPRAGFSDLSDQDAAAAVDYMLSTLDLAVPRTAKESLAAQPARSTSTNADDATLVASVTEALRTRVLSRAKIERASPAWSRSKTA